MKKAILMVLIFCLLGCSHYKTYTTNTFRLHIGEQVFTLEHINVNRLLEAEVCYPLLKNGDTFWLEVERRFSYKTPEGEIKQCRVRMIYWLKNKDGLIEIQFFDIWWYDKTGQEIRRVDEGIQ